MYVGMYLAARYLVAPLTPVFGAEPAAYWAMFLGMAGGQLLTGLAGQGLKSARPPTLAAGVSLSAGPGQRRV
jgi:hypothetical protein